MSKFEAFLGVWHLEPDSVRYDFGKPPRKGSYTITQNGDRLTFTMDWIDHAGNQRHLAYSEVADGRFHPYADKPVADEIRLRLTSPTTLESVARKNGGTVMVATRELLAENRMKVVKSGTLRDGRSYRNTSCYAK